MVNRQRALSSLKDADSYLLVNSLYGHCEAHVMGHPDLLVACIAEAIKQQPEIADLILSAINTAIHGGQE